MAQICGIRVIASSAADPQNPLRLISGADLRGTSSAGDDAEEANRRRRRLTASEEGRGRRGPRRRNRSSRPRRPRPPPRPASVSGRDERAVRHADERAHAPPRTPSRASRAAAKGSPTRDERGLSDASIESVARDDGDRPHGPPPLEITTEHRMTGTTASERDDPQRRSAGVTRRVEEQQTRRVRREERRGARDRERRPQRLRTSRARRQVLLRSPKTRAGRRRTISRG